mmetsp:Transcript_26735/g.92276  ORF Transcript_26735/g.92276 Transcript_26735/m.92276 type:complete len:319 (-) Transcript_26735:974-1930(-)
MRTTRSTARRLTRTRATTGPDGPDVDEPRRLQMDSTPDGDNIAANLKAAVDNMVEPDLAYKKDVQALPSDSLRAELGRRGLSQEGLKAALVERLWGAVRAAFPEASGMESGDPTVKMNLHRMKQVLFHLTFLWAGKGLKWKGGGELQRVVVDLFLHDERLRGMWEARCASDAAEAAEAARVTKAAHDALVAAGFDAPMFDAALHAGGPAGWTEVWDDDAAITRRALSRHLFLGSGSSSTRRSASPSSRSRCGSTATSCPSSRTSSTTCCRSWPRASRRCKSTCCCSSSACCTTRRRARTSSRLRPSRARRLTRIASGC